MYLPYSRTFDGIFLIFIPHIVLSFVNMPATTRKRKASEEEDATPEVVPAAVKTSRASQQPSKARKSAKKGRSGTIENLNSARTPKSIKPTASSVSTAKRDIRKKADELIHLIEIQSTNEVLVCRAEDRLGNLGSGITATESKTTPLRKTMIGLEHEQTSRNPNTIYQKSCEHLQNMQETIDEYKRLNHATANLKKPLEIKQWEQDSEDIAKVDKRAMEITINTLNGIVLGEKTADYPRSAAQLDDEVEQAARRWLRTGVSTREDTWGDVVREALKALSGITKILS
ncbi:hypothetical protein M441DRAFT_69751 [Trichoderma asperellum CBS 433.97]|uniref:Uncharacterized protein n=1 Tax=Trichoderma asperellum (strain ATCC 204424 / CBS 433.97 / NBRC 101777) TaxID=1042311 RepID=A0A2T3Z513_TRIA4|nr:hypothetical protein M441DRAFT_69751 [Trichoderma asperellum CBS 433.97]PTB39884.1 hypothetical protein M441DRAFT_69751 [Trichoderma asperellum CBS 433.97]